MRHFSYIIAIFFIFGLVLSAWAGPTAKIEYTTGDDIVIIRDSKKIGTNSDGDYIGVELIEKDQIQTGEDVFVEIRLSDNSLVKISENTTFIFDKMNDSSTDLNLVYGKVRSKINKLANKKEYNVATYQSVAGVRGTDFGVEVNINSGNSSTLTYCFSGEVEVTKVVKNDEPVPEPISIKTGQMVAISTESLETAPKEIDKKIMEYWEKAEMVSPIQDIPEEKIETISGEPVQMIGDYKKGFDDATSIYSKRLEEVLRVDEYSYQKKLSKVRNISAWSWAFCTVANVALSSAMVYFYDNNQNSKILKHAWCSVGFASLSIPLAFFTLYPEILVKDTRGTK